MHRTSVFVVGSFIMGLTIRVSRPPAAGETLMGYGFDLGPGGKGINMAIALKRAGAQVDLMLCIGQDLFGQQAMAVLKQENLSTQYVHQSTDQPTGCGFVTLLPSGENSIVINSGANLCMTPDLLVQAEAAIKASSVLICQLEVTPDVAEVSMVMGKKHGCMTILNPAPAQPLSACTLSHVDVLTPNETEAKILLGLPPDADVPTETLIGQLLKLGPKAVVLTQGKHGALIATDAGIQHIFSPVIDLADSTGAGDAFNGNMARELAQGKSLREAVERAVYAGAFCAGTLGVINGLPTTTELDKFINQHRV
ncbi:MAG: ribokinase [Spirosoma sp.]|nr:ribokinase [Spirosoma sp.]